MKLPPFYLLLVLASLLVAGCSQESSTSSGANGSGRLRGAVVSPLEGTYLYVYKQGMDLYGPAFAISEATGPDGAFDLALPEGEYIVVARKRNNGDTTGPVVAGDNKSDFTTSSLRRIWRR